MTFTIMLRVVVMIVGPPAAPTDRMEFAVS